MRWRSQIIETVCAWISFWISFSASEGLLLMAWIGGSFTFSLWVAKGVYREVVVPELTRKPIIQSRLSLSMSHFLGWYWRRRWGWSDGEQMLMLEKGWKSMYLYILESESLTLTSAVRRQEVWQKNLQKGRQNLHFWMPFCHHLWFKSNFTAKYTWPVLEVSYCKL